MLAIRLARVGKKNKAQFKIVLQEHTVAPGGRHVEILGSYDPHRKHVEVEAERVKYWLEKGAQMSDTVHNLMVGKGVISGKKRKVKIPASPASGPAKVIEKAEGESAPEKKPEEKPKEEAGAKEAETEKKPKKEEKPKKEIKPKEAKPEEKKAE